MIFQILSQDKHKEKEKTAATLASNRSRRLCEWFYESEKAGWMVSLFREEKQILLKV